MTVRRLARSRWKAGAAHRQHRRSTGSGAVPQTRTFSDARSGNVRRAAQFRPRCHGRRTTNDRDPSENHAQRTSLDRSGKVRLKMDRGMNAIRTRDAQRRPDDSLCRSRAGRRSGQWFRKEQVAAERKDQDGAVDSGIASRRSWAAIRQTEPRCLYVPRSPCSSSTARIASGGWEYPRKLLRVRRMTRLKQT